MVSYGCQNAFWVSNVLVTLKSTETDGVYIITHSIGMEASERQTVDHMLNFDSHRFIFLIGLLRLMYIFDNLSF